MSVGELPALASGPIDIPVNSQYSGPLLTLEVNPNQPAGLYGTGALGSTSVAVVMFYGSILDPTNQKWEGQGLISAQVSETPEPAAVSLFAVAAAAILVRRRSPR